MLAVDYWNIADPAAFVQKTVVDYNMVLFTQKVVYFFSDGSSLINSHITMY